MASLDSNCRIIDASTRLKVYPKTFSSGSQDIRGPSIWSNPFTRIKYVSFWPLDWASYQVSIGSLPAVSVVIAIFTVRLMFVPTTTSQQSTNNCVDHHRKWLVASLRFPHQIVFLTLAGTIALNLFSRAWHGYPCLQGGGFSSATGRPGGSNLRFQQVSFNRLWRERFDVGLML